MAAFRQMWPEVVAGNDSWGRIRRGGGLLVVDPTGWGVGETELPLTMEAEECYLGVCTF